jgi:hydroxyacylglutathione hydrolase
MMRCEILLYGDNFFYLLIDGGRAAVVDPGNADVVQRALQELGLSLDCILITHHHGDHTAGCLELKRATGCRLIGPTGGSVPFDTLVGEGNDVSFSSALVSVMAVPGHTQHDVAYYLPSESMLFVGDVLFAGGCGRLFTGDAAMMWSSLCRLRSLPGETRIYGGHDYRIDSLRFAADFEPQNREIQERLSRAVDDPQAGFPSTLAEELQTNPFLRCDAIAVKEAAGLPTAAAEMVFAEIRRRKDKG